MPYADPEKRRESTKAWRTRVIAQGYGKWLYARRKLRFDDAERFQDAIERALNELAEEPLSAQATPVSNAIAILSEALTEAREAEEALGRWEGAET